MLSRIDKVLVFIFGTIFSIPLYSTAKCRGMRHRIPLIFTTH
ncbi:hypothetical protein Patl1_25851 [Pistacia atlantica]|uniref:Uncharacterized protein n=1 Tax=Pistacia atlantica TaxID=434234 RepID=A0ACC1AZR5_9ROSI|nr:hypothetical protein Patl1_25851 [Pistacia atlantica]